MDSTKKLRPVDELFDRYFHVRYSHFHAKTSEQLQRQGVRVSGIPELDDSVDRDIVDSELNINGMFELFCRGVTIRVVKYADTAEIYRIIQMHLKTWLEHLATSVNVGDPEVIRELIELDRFASTVYDKAASVFTEMERVQLKNPRFGVVQPINFFNILKRNYAEVTQVRRGPYGEEIISLSETTDQPNVEEVKPRESLQDAFVHHMNIISGWQSHG